ncbi:hypothetical protein Pan153_31830 [Gimesia panareensis]|uniref:Uncharacterized protein n=1 Tax=Gimesia panareensis TaxID=2527978 RepID=A0A518FQG2_9PLAN|nr:hypothetical protein [Gimesia panareensis]QDV18525.1 hypothetical protein Pan153_31830 [Gimesia panareensis]
MRSKTNDFFSTILVLIPLVAVPMLAIFGIPEIAPVKKSALNEKDLFDQEDSTQSPFEEISFDSSSHEIDLGGEGNLNGSAANGQAGQNPFGKMAANPQRKKRDAEWLPPAGALDGWEFESAPQKLDPAQGMAELNAAAEFPGENRRPDNRLPGNREPNPIQQAGFDDQPGPSSGVENAFGQEIQQFENPGPNPFGAQNQEPGAVQQASAEEPVREVDPQFRQRAELMLRRDPATWSAAVQKLNELGIRDYRLEPGGRPNEFLFSCSYSPPQNPRISRRFEAEALDPLKAVIKVLQQVDEWNNQK